MVQVFDVGLLLNYKLIGKLQFNVEAYDSCVRGQDVNLSDEGIEHLYIEQIEAETPQEALQKVIDGLALNEWFEFYNYETKDTEWIQGILTKYEIGFLDDKLMFEYENIEQEINALC